MQYSGFMRQTAIFLVEDDDVDAETIRRFFQRSNISNPFFRAKDGIEGLLKLRDPEYAEFMPPLLLVDIYMPCMTGLEFLEEVRSDERLKSSVTFMLTTSDREQDKTHAYSLNVAGYILKERIKDLAGFLNQYLTINCPPDQDNGQSARLPIFAPSPSNDRRK